MILMLELIFVLASFVMPSLSFTVDGAILQNPKFALKLTRGKKQLQYKHRDSSVKGRFAPKQLGVQETSASPHQNATCISIHDTH